MLKVISKEHYGWRRRSEKHYAGHESQQQREQGGPGLAPNGIEQAFRAPGTDTSDVVVGNGGLLAPTMRRVL